jgi:signal transduction histidine kinase
MSKTTDLSHCQGSGIFFNSKPIIRNQSSITKILLNKIKYLRQRVLNQSEFLSHMSHELRAPLNNIINFNRFVLGHDLGHINRDQEQALLQSIQSAEQLLALINNVLDVTKIEADMMRLFIEDNINIQKLINEIALSATAALADKPVELHINISPEIPYIVGDRRRIHQISLNLVSNAWKFTQEGLIEISGKLQGDNVIILVKDTGSGVSQSDLDRIFEPFEQTKVGLVSASSTGLGLPITKKLVEAHGGEMIVQSRLGIGSTFGFCIPTRSITLLDQMQEDMKEEAG